MTEWTRHKRAGKTGPSSPRGIMNGPIATRRSGSSARCAIGSFRAAFAKLLPTVTSNHRERKVTLTYAKTPPLSPSMRNGSRGWKRIKPMRKSAIGSMNAEYRPANQAETTPLAETRSDAIVIPPVAEIKTMARTVLSDAGLRAQWMRRGFVEKTKFPLIPGDLLTNGNSLSSFHKSASLAFGQRFVAREHVE
jgi:hypothetical protein